MRKGILIILMMILLVSIVTATGEDCQISTNNITWSNVSITVWSGCVDNENNVTVIQNLDECTQYFVRCKTSTSAWGYNQLKTECGWNGMYLTIAFIGAIFIAMGYFMLYKKKDNGD